MIKKDFKYGFSLTELLVSITIMAVLSLLVVGAVAKKTKKTLSAPKSGRLICYKDINGELHQRTEMVKATGGTAEITDEIVRECKFEVPAGANNAVLYIIGGGGGGGANIEGGEPEYATSEQDIKLDIPNISMQVVNNYDYVDTLHSLSDTFKVYYTNNDTRQLKEDDIHISTSGTRIIDSDIFGAPVYVYSYYDNRSDMPLDNRICRLNGSLYGEHDAYYYLTGSSGPKKIYLYKDSAGGILREVQIERYPIIDCNSGDYVGIQDITQNLRKFFKQEYITENVARTYFGNSFCKIAKKYSGFVKLECPVLLHHPLGYKTNLFINIRDNVEKLCYLIKNNTKCYTADQPLSDRIKAKITSVEGITVNYGTPGANGNMISLTPGSAYAGKTITINKDDIGNGGDVGAKGGDTKFEDNTATGGNAGSQLQRTYYTASEEGEKLSGEGDLKSASAKINEDIDPESFGTNRLSEYYIKNGVGVGSFGEDPVIPNSVCSKGTKYDSGNESYYNLNYGGGGGGYIPCVEYGRVYSATLNYYDSDDNQHELIYKYGSNDKIAPVYKDLNQYKSTKGMGGAVILQWGE